MKRRHARVKTAYPKYTNVVPGAVWRSVRLDHAKHTVKLPQDEEHDEQMVRVPESLKVDPTLSFSGKEKHNGEAKGHQPSSDTRTGREVCSKKRNKDIGCAFRVGAKLC